MHVIVCEPHEFPEESYIAELYPYQDREWMKHDCFLLESANPGNTYRIYKLEPIE
jgi:hypothetical protein